MPRVIWKGAISFGLVHIPVNLYPAENAKELSFNMLDRRDMAPIGYHRINKVTGEDVPSAEIVKGYEYEDGEYVVLTDEDFRQANVEASQTVDIIDFVDQDRIPVVYYDRPYYLAPGKKGEKSYALLRETLKRTGKVGMATVVIRTRQHLAALVPVDDMLVLELLRFSDEIRAYDELDLPGSDLKKLGVSEKELDMAQRLVEDMVEDWKPEKYHDDYHDDLMAMIERKVKEGKTKTITEPAKDKGKETASAEVIDLMALLKRSIEEKGKPAGVKAKTQSKPAAATRAKAKPKVVTEKPANRKRA